LEGKVKSLEEELVTVKTNFDHLEMIYKVVSYNENEFCKPINCKNCEVVTQS